MYSMEVTNMKGFGDKCPDCDECVGPSEDDNDCTCWTTLGDTDELEIIDTNERGGKNSRIDVRYDLIPAQVFKALAEVFNEGSIKYEDDNWKQVPGMDHLNHMLNHIMEYRMTGNKEDLTHAGCRMIMFMFQELFQYSGDNS